MARYFFISFAVVLCWVYLTLTSGGKVSFVDVPYASGEWDWKLYFFYTETTADSANGTPDEQKNYTFDPASTAVSVDKKKYEESGNRTIYITFTMTPPADSKLENCELSLIVELDEEYFAWTNMTLSYKLKEALSKTKSSEVTSQEKIDSLPDQKFLTRTDEVYECQTEIPIYFNQSAAIVFTGMTFQAFNAEKDISPNRLREVCPRDFKSNIPITALTVKSTLADQTQLPDYNQKSGKDVNPLISANVSECIEIRNSNSQSTPLSSTPSSSSSSSGTTSNLYASESQLPPLNRITVICQDDLRKLCALFEFRGYFLIQYTNSDTNESVCYRIAIDLREDYSTNDGTIYILDKSPIFLNNTFNDLTNFNSNAANDINKSKSPYNEPDNLRVLTTNSSCCNTFNRCFTLPLSSTDKNDESFFKDWIIEFHWNRTPEMYEFGEDGWSSVGTPVGALSGVYDLVDVKLKYRLHENFGLDFLNHEYVNKEFTVHSLAEKRLQARVGDYYECLSETQIIFDTEDNKNNSNSKAIVDQRNGQSSTYKQSDDRNNLRIIMSLKNVKSQAFADVNVPEFTGASVVCSGDISHDMTMSIAIGLSLCALVVCVLFGLAINHLRQKDQTFKAVDTTGDDLK
ncbi:unnamed protein product [Trichobilharzia szidati]|nr:unnamed protein product [Trichobilharzia szidati]